MWAGGGESHRSPWLQCLDDHTKSVLMIMRSLQAAAWNWLEIKRLFYLNICPVFGCLWGPSSGCESVPWADCLLGEVGPAACINIRWFKSHNYLLKSFAKSITFPQLSLWEREILCGHVGKYYQSQSSSLTREIRTSYLVVSVWPVRGSKNADYYYDKSTRRLCWMPCGTSVNLPRDDSVWPQAARTVWSSAPPLSY